MNLGTSHKYNTDKKWFFTLKYNTIWDIPSVSQGESATVFRKYSCY